MSGTKAKRCADGYGAKSLRIMREAKARGMHLDAGGLIHLQSGGIHVSTPQDGRDRINLSIDGEKVTIQTARVVCFLAHGEPPTPTSVADHIDGNTLNDHPDNLRWATYSENARNTVHTRTKTHEQRCVEACAGIDPAAVPAMAAALKAALSYITSRRRTNQREVIDGIREALALAKGGAL